MIVGRWYVRSAAIWHWCLALCFYLVCFLIFILSTHSLFIFFFDLVLIDRLFATELQP